MVTIIPQPPLQPWPSTRQRQWSTQSAACPSKPSVLPLWVSCTTVGAMWCPRSPPKGWAKPLAGKMHVNAYGAVGKLHAYRIMQGFVPKKQVYTKNLPSMTHNPYSRVYYFDLALGFLSFNDGIMMVWSGWGDSCVGHHDTKGDFGAWPMPPSRRGQITARADPTTAYLPICQARWRSMVWSSESGCSDCDST